MAQCPSGFSLSIVIADSSGSGEVTTICLISYFYQVQLEHIILLKTALELPTLMCGITG